MSEPFLGGILNTDFNDTSPGRTFSDGCLFPVYKSPISKHTDPPTSGFILPLSAKIAAMGDINELHNGTIVSCI